MRIVMAIAYRWRRQAIPDRFYDGKPQDALELIVYYEDGSERSLVRISRFVEGWAAWGIDTMRWRGPYRSALEALRQVRFPLAELRRLGVPCWPRVARRRGA